jgi:hypothetical protein
VQWYTPPQQTLIVGDHAAAATDAGIVEQQMDLVGVLLFGGFVAEALHLRLVGYVGDMGGDAEPLRQALRLTEPSGLRHRSSGDIAHRDITAFGHKLAHQLAAHARAAAGDDGDPAGKILHGVSLPG